MSKKLPRTSKTDEIKLKETILALSTCTTQTKAAEKLGISHRALTNRLNKWQLREYIAEMTNDALASLQLGSKKAAENFVNKLDSRNESISMDASREILDRVGLKVQQNPAVQNNIQINLKKVLENEEFRDD